MVALRDWSWYVIVLGLFVAVVALVSSPGWIGRLAERLRGLVARGAAGRDVGPCSTVAPLVAGIAGLGLLRPGGLAHADVPRVRDRGRAGRAGIATVVALLADAAPAAVSEPVRSVPPGVRRTSAAEPSAPAEAAAAAEAVDEVG